MPRHLPWFSLWIAPLAIVPSSLSGDEPSGSRATTERPASVATSGVGERSSTRPVVSEVPGWVRPARSVVIHPMAGSLVQELSVREGERVAEGEELISMVDPVTRAAVDAARIQAEQSGPLDLARSEHHYAQRLVDRMESVRDDRGVSASEREQAAAARDKALAGLAIAEENASLARARYALELARLESLRLRAPFAGIVASIDVEVGQKVFDDTPMLRLIDPTELTVVLHHPWRYRDRLQVGMRRELTADAPLGVPVVAELVHIDPMLDVALQAVRCRWRIDNHDGRYPAGFLVVADCSTWPIVGSDSSDVSERPIGETADARPSISVPSIAD
ncbi:MAG TPA: efflux RND transporter periplasmic adaptor subunit [Pirellulaceae bacterium]|nr:efflux RND transporter periplasmic adaptor subunit [Pirellulaceae bacterium]